MFAVITQEGRDHLKTVGAFCTSSPTVAHVSTHTSPSGRYSAKGYELVSPERTMYNFNLFDGSNPIGSATCLYRSAPHIWLEEHPSGHAFFITSMGVRGFIIVDLTANTVTHTPAPEKDFWCMAEFSDNGAQTLLAVEGCYWGDRYNLRVYDLATLPHISVLARSEESHVLDYGWVSDDTLRYLYEYEHCMTYDKPSYDQTDAEEEHVEALEAAGTKNLYEYRQPTCLWNVLQKASPQE